MRQISQSYRTGRLSLVDVARPSAPRDGIVVETAVSLISAGTERTLVDMARKSLVEKARERPDLVKKVLDKARREGPLAAFDAVRNKLDNPIPLGYSLAGRVASVGAGAVGFGLGDRVACAGAGFANHAEFNAVPTNLAVRIPEKVSDEEASFVTVGAIALHGVRLVEPTLGATVVVIGLGLLGQLAVQLLTAHGCDVVGVDLDQAKVERAVARGARVGVVVGRDDAVEAVRSLTRGAGADGVVITASAPDNGPLELAGEVARDRAVISVVGLLPLEIPRKTFYEKELSVVVSRSYGPGRYDPDYEERGRDYPIGYVRWTERRNLSAVLHAIETQRLEVSSLITHRFAFDDAMSAYEVITGERKEPHLGVVLRYPAKNEEARVTEPVANVLPLRTRSPKAPLGLAVIGTGGFATGVLLPALTALDDVKLVATVSGRGLSARHAADRFGADRVAGSLDEALAMAEVDAVVIATRHASHASSAAKALTAGRDVFVEKPAAIDEEQLSVLAEAVERSGRCLQVGFNRRFAPFAIEVSEVFKHRRAGLVMTARVNAGVIPATSWIVDPGEGGGRIVGEGCHFIDLMASWAGSEPTRVSAHAIGSEGGYQRDDNAVVNVDFADGSVGTLIYTAMGDPGSGKERYEVFCEGTTVVIDDWRRMDISHAGRTRTRRALKADKGHAEQLRRFVAACRAGAESPTPWRTVAAVTRATFAAELSRRERVTVELCEGCDVSGGDTSEGGH